MGRSGISRSQQFAEMGFASQVWGMPADIPRVADRKLARHMAQDALWSYHAMAEAIRTAELPSDRVQHDRTGVIFGTGGPATKNIVDAADVNRKTGSPKRLGAFFVP